MSLEDARAADRAGKLETAANLYEEVVAGGDAGLEERLDLAVLYWQATDPGMVSADAPPPGFFAKAARRFPELLVEAEHRFASRSEPRFWRRYIAWADLGEELECDECLALLEEDPESLVPVMYVFAASRGVDCEAEARELLRRCHRDATTRARYVASVIEGVLLRSSRGR